MVMANFIFMYVFLYNKSYPYEKSKNFCSAYIFLFLGELKHLPYKKDFRVGQQVIYCIYRLSFEGWLESGAIFVFTHTNFAGQKAATSFLCHLVNVLLKIKA